MPSFLSESASRGSPVDGASPQHVYACMLDRDTLAARVRLPAWSLDPLPQILGSPAKELSSQIPRSGQRLGRREDSSREAAGSGWTQFAGYVWGFGCRVGLLLSFCDSASALCIQLSGSASKFGIGVAVFQVSFKFFAVFQVSFKFCQHTSASEVLPRC